MKIRTNHYINSKSFFIILITIFFSLSLGLGLYGYGHDFYGTYRINNITTWGAWNDKLGYLISTLTLFNIHIGVYLVSGILAASTGVLLKNFLLKRKINSIYFFIILYIITLHTWPIIMSTSNAMRQGIAMSFIFLYLSCYDNKLDIKSLLFISLSILTHNSGLFFLFIFLNTLIIKKISDYFRSDYFRSDQYKRSFYFIYGIIIFFSTFVLLKIFRGSGEATHIIGKDFRIPFLLISLTYIVILTYKLKFLELYNINLFIYIFSFVAPAVFFSGLNWQYERLNMMVVILYILGFSTLLTKKISQYFLIASLSSLLLLTIYTGMYKSLI
tara:strand:- start:451 stop:1437 length:987 start_codon:yes stop_codon:yes gene_type:complete